MHSQFVSTHSDKVWEGVVRRLEKRLEKVAEFDFIPVTSLKAIEGAGGRLPSRVADKVRNRGVVVIRGTLDRKTTSEIEEGVLDYLQENDAFLPNENDTVYEIFWSKAQMRARTDPGMVTVMKALLGLWHSDQDSDMDLSSPLMYVDTFHRRPPWSRFPLPSDDLGERWQDPNNRQVYRKILEGSPEEYDPWLTGHRPKAANGAGTFFRGFHGWLSLSSSGPGSGTLKVLPNLAEAIPYLLLRSLLPDLPPRLFTGVSPSQSVHNSSPLHSNISSLASATIQELDPGDTVWWHPDLLHQLEEWNTSSTFNSVLYLSAGPDCPRNRNYLRRLRHALITRSSPPDFPSSTRESSYRGRVGLSDLSSKGRVMMGWPKSSEPSTKTCTL